MSTLLNDNDQDSDKDSLNPDNNHYRDTYNNLKSGENNSTFNYHPESENSNLSSNDLSEAEKNQPNPVNSLYKSLPSKDTGSKSDALKAKIKKAAKKKLLIGGVLGGSSVVIILFGLLILVVGSMKLPNIMQDITSYEFATITSDMAQSTIKITEENLSVDATNPSTWQALKDKYTQGYQDIKDSIWGKLDAYNPDTILKNLGESGDLKLTYKITPLGSKQWTGGVLDGKEYSVAEVDGIGKWIPGIRQILQEKNAAVTRSDLLDAIMQKEEINSLGLITKGRFFLRALEATDGSLSGWLLSKFSNKDGKPMNTTEAQDEASLQTEDASQSAMTVADTATTSEIATAEENYNNQLAKDTNNPAAVKTIVKSDGIDVAAETAADEALKTNLLSSAVGFIDPLYAIALPICIVYDGSISQSGPPIANQTAEQQNIFDKLVSEADQQKQGDLNTKDSLKLAAAVKGTNAELGNITNSVPYLRASGVAVSTASIPRAEAGSDGGYTYSIFSLLNLSPSQTTLLNKVIGPLCQGLTNVYAGIGIGVANIVGSILSDGGLDSLEAAASEGAHEFITELVSIIKSRIMDTVIGKDTATETIDSSTKLGKLSRIIRFGFSKAKKEAPKIAGLVGITLLAHMIVAERTGAGNNGFAQGSNLVDIADSGANIEANQIARTEFFGRPLTTPEIGQQIQNASQLVAEANASRSFTQRYFAVTNADSLVTHLGTTLGQYMHPTIISSFIKFCTSLFNPATYIGKLLSFSGVVQASVSPLNQVYGNIQFGWTKSEQALINSSNSYYPLENQRILDKSGQEAAIAKTYAFCFGYQYNPNGNGDMNPRDPNGDMRPDFSGTEPGSLASLITSNAVQRDSQGNVIANLGTCSPNNLGPNNNQFGKGMLFRWRLAMNYFDTLDNLNSVQNISNGP